jgi:catalase (peroxidase I)
VAIAGGPRAGKSHLAAALSDLGHWVRAADELRGLGWSESSLAASTWFDEPGAWICEGVAMPRALRKWLTRNPEGSPADAIVWINAPVMNRSRGQHVMAVGCETVWNQIRPELLRREIQLFEM